MAITAIQPDTTLPKEPNVKMWLGNLRPDGGNPPGQYVNKNTIGQIIWTRAGDGTYIGTLADTFTERMTTIHAQSPESGIAVSAFRIDEDQVSVKVFDTATGLDTDITNDISLEIKIYQTVYE